MPTIEDSFLAGKPVITGAGVDAVPLVVPEPRAPPAADPQHCTELLDRVAHAEFAPRAIFLTAARSYHSTRVVWPSGGGGYRTQRLRQRTAVVLRAASGNTVTSVGSPGTILWEVNHQCGSWNCVGSGTYASFTVEVGAPAQQTRGSCHRTGCSVGVFTHSDRRDSR